MVFTLHDHPSLKIHSCCAHLQGVNKGVVAETIFASMEGRKQADFVLCIGDDRSDEDMFENIADIMKRNMVAPRILFACSGTKPSKAKF